MLKDEKDMILVRRNLSNYPLVKRWGNWVMSLAGSLSAGRRYQDIESGFRIMRAEVLRELTAYYVGYRYSCAQEIAVILARRKFRVSNDYILPVLYYRSRTRIKDAAANVLLGAWVALKCLMEWRDPQPGISEASRFVIFAPPKEAVPA